VNAGDLAHLSGFTVDGPVLLTCDRCRDGGVFGPAGQDVQLSSLAIWARDHRCPGPSAEMPARELMTA
jgi:hypothetical protein